MPDLDALSGKSLLRAAVGSLVVGVVMYVIFVIPCVELCVLYAPFILVGMASAGLTILFVELSAAMKRLIPSWAWLMAALFSGSLLTLGVGRETGIVMTIVIFIVAAIVGSVLVAYSDRHHIAQADRLFYNYVLIVLALGLAGGNIAYLHYEAGKDLAAVNTIVRCQTGGMEQAHLLPDPAQNPKLNESFCSRMHDDDARASCYGALAVVSGNASICEKASNRSCERMFNF